MRDKPQQDDTETRFPFKVVERRGGVEILELDCTDDEREALILEFIALFGNPDAPTLERAPDWREALAARKGAKE